MRYFIAAALSLAVSGTAHAEVQRSRALPPSDAAAAAASTVVASPRPQLAVTASAARPRPSPADVAPLVRPAALSGLSAALPPSEGGTSRPQPRMTPAVAVVAAVVEARTRPAPRAPRRVDGGDGDVRCIAQAVFHEARGEPERGQRAVADVVMNRARSGRWGSGACAVVNAPRQFSNRWSWRMPQVGVPAWDRALDIAKDALSGVVGVSSRLMNFRASYMGAGGSSPMRIGRHVFW